VSGLPGLQVACPVARIDAPRVPNVFPQHLITVSTTCGAGAAPQGLDFLFREKSCLLWEKNNVFQVHYSVVQEVDAAVQEVASLVHVADSLVQRQVFVVQEVVTLAQETD